MVIQFIIKNEQREHLKILREKSCESVVDLCKLALDYLTNGPNEKKCNVIAKKMNVPSTTALTTIEALVCLLIDVTEKNITEEEFETIKSFGFSKEIIAILWQFVSSKRLFLKNILKCINTKRLRYRDLDWRFEGKISSRCYLNSSQPIITMKIHLDSKELIENRSVLNDTDGTSNDNGSTGNEFNNSKYDVLIEIDPNNLIYLINVLEQALLESRNYRISNISKAF